MLPGFRFLFAAIMLSMSLLVFGLGAAALLRAAHESFASNSSWRAAPEVAFAQPPETTLPMLATLSVEPATEKPTAQAAIAAPAEPAKPPTPAITTAHPELVPAVTEPAKTDQVAAAQPTQAPVEVTKPDHVPAKAPVAMPAAQDPPASDAAAPPAPVTETKAAAVGASDAASTARGSATVQLQPAPMLNPPSAAPTAPASPAASPTAAATAEPATSAAAARSTAPATSPQTSEAETRIATLGGPPVDVAPDTSATANAMAKHEQAKEDQSAIKKREQARRALRRRRLAERARLLAQQQFQANPFAQQPFAQPQQSLTVAAPRQPTAVPRQ